MNDDVSRDTMIVIVLDRSGSMEPIRDATIAGVNEFVAEQRRVEGRATLTLVLFDNEYLLLHDGVPLEDVPPLTRETYVPRGTTALLDAWGRAMAETEWRIAAQPEAERPDEVVFVVMTDGYENASREWNEIRLFVAVEQRRTEQGWRFIYLGANQDAIEVSQRYGVDADHSLTYASSAVGTHSVIATLSSSVSRARQGRIAGLWFTEEERAEQDRLIEKDKKKLH